MREKYQQITAIIDEIDSAQPNLRAKAVSAVEEQMHRLEQELIAKDKEMKTVS